MAIDTYVLRRIEMLQKELDLLKSLVLNRPKGEVVSLRGIWEGMDFSDEDIEEAKDSLFRDRHGTNS